MNLTRTSQRKRSAFTLMEMMLVLGIIALLLGAGVYAMVNVFGQGQEVKALSDVRTIEAALISYRTTTSMFPSEVQGLSALVNRPTEGKVPDRWKRVLKPKAIIDPWGNPYQYRYPGRQNPENYDIYSFGPDQQEGTADDIGNWQ